MNLRNITIFVLALALGAGWYLNHMSNKTASIAPETWWRPGNEKSVNTAIRKFTISLPNTEIENLKNRLRNTRFGAEPLIGTGWTYGMSSKSLKTIVDYWTNKYNFEQRLKVLNQYPQFVTNIQGLDIHFLHVKPENAGGKRVLPLLLQHGWPGSVVEFYDIIPLLTTPRPEYDFVFEVIVPSLPGYGFSDAPTLPGCGPAEIAVVLKNLMLRLGFDKFYGQGGDWGALITAEMAMMFPQHVLGIHQNMCTSSNIKSMLKGFLYNMAPSIFLDEEDAKHHQSLKTLWSFILEETGYFHIQATKPDTVGAALSDSPAGLAAYILEKFSTWTDRKARALDDGGLLKKYTMDKLIDNLMLYWLPNKITTSARLYAEAMVQFHTDGDRHNAPIIVPSACAQFPEELQAQPASILRDRYKQLVRVTRMERGGHFAAMEEPKLLADDVWAAIKEMEVLRKAPTKKQ